MSIEIFCALKVHVKLSCGAPFHLLTYFLCVQGDLLLHSMLKVIKNSGLCTIIAY